MNLYLAIGFCVFFVLVVILSIIHVREQTIKKVSMLKKANRLINKDLGECEIDESRIPVKFAEKVGMLESK